MHHLLPATHPNIAARLASTAGYPAIMLVTDPGQDWPVTTERTGDDSPVPVLTIGNGLLHGDPSTPNGRLAAGAMAHALVCFDWPTSPSERRWSRWTRVALVTLAVGVAFGSGRTVALALFAYIVAVLGFLAAQRRSECAVDRAAVQLLDAAELDGPACVRELLADIADHESAAYRRIGWFISGVPTAAARMRALDTA